LIHDQEKSTIVQEHLHPTVGANVGDETYDAWTAALMIGGLPDDVGEVDDTLIIGLDQSDTHPRVGILHAKQAAPTAF
jgi:hypothetical protein